MKKSIYLVISIILTFAACKKTRVVTDKKNSGRTPASSSEQGETDGVDKNSRSAEDDSNNSSSKPKATSSTSTPGGDIIAANITATGKSGIALADGISIVLELPYESTQQGIPITCSLDNLQHIAMMSECTCTNGTCSVVIKNIHGGNWDGSAQYHLYDKSGKKSSASLSFQVSANLVDSAANAFGSFIQANNIEIVNANLSLTERNHSLREIRYDEASGNISDPDIDTTALIGYWRVNGGLGSAIPVNTGGIADLSDASMHATYIDVDASADDAYSQGFLGEGITLAGDDYLNISGSYDPVLQNQGTAMMWMKRDFQLDESNIIHLLEFWGDSENNIVCQHFSTTESVQCSFEANNVALAISVPTAAFSSQQWTHFALTWDTAGKFLIYLNGRPMRFAAISNTFLAPLDEMHIGSCVNCMTSNYKGWKGSLDEISLWSKALSSEEIYNKYHHQAVPYGKLSSNIFESRVIDGGPSGNTWEHISWKASMPLGKELPIGSNSQSPPYNASNTESLYTNENATTDLLTGLEGYWRLNGEGSADIFDVIEDSSGNEMHGELLTSFSSTEYQQGILNQSLVFAGDDYIHVDPNIPFNQNQLSVSVWFNLANVAATTKCIFTNSNGVGGNPMFRICASPTKNIEVYFGGNDTCNGAVLRLLDFGPMLETDKWYHIAVVADVDPAGNGNIYGYFNGHLGRSIKMVNTPLCADAGRVSIGATWSNNNIFHGKLDELAYWSRPLSHDEIWQVYARVANSIKFQIRTCNLADCSDGNYVGPGNSASSYYTEALNSSIGFPFVSLDPVPSSRFIQYKAIIDYEGRQFQPKLLEVGFQN